MSRSLIFRPRARTDLDAAYAWYEARPAGRGDDFLTEFRSAADLVRQHPDRYGVAYRGLRAAPLPRSKYVVYYRLDPTEVVVVAVLHTRADLRRLRGRR